MSKKSFVFLVLTVVASLLFAMGMCMCLLPEWNAFKPGVVVTALGIVSLLAIGLVRWTQSGKPLPQVDWKAVGKVSYGVVSALVLGVGMSMVLVFENMMIPGMIVGVVGIVMLLGLIPVVKGLK